MASRYTLSALFFGQLKMSLNPINLRLLDASSVSFHAHGLDTAFYLRICFFLFKQSDIKLSVCLLAFLSVQIMKTDNNNSIVSAKHVPLLLEFENPVIKRTKLFVSPGL